jgi:hypothetical protein
MYIPNAAITPKSFESRQKDHRVYQDSIVTTATLRKRSLERFTSSQLRKDRKVRERERERD